MANSSNSPCFIQKDYQGKLGYELPDTEDLLFQIHDLPLLDPHAFEAIYAQKDWEHMLTQFLKVFINESLPEDKKLIHAAHDDLNWAQVERLAHKIKGGCVCIGLQRFAIACQFLERYIKAGHSNKNEELYQQMLLVMEDTASEIKTWITAHP